MTKALKMPRTFRNLNWGRSVTVASCWGGMLLWIILIKMMLQSCMIKAKRCNRTQWRRLKPMKNYLTLRVMTLKILNNEE